MNQTPRNPDRLDLMSSESERYKIVGISLDLLALLHFMIVQLTNNPYSMFA